MFLNGIHHLSNTALWPRAELNPRSRAGLFFCRNIRFNTYMDSDLENVIRQALEDAQAAGYDHMAQTVLAVQAVQQARPDMTAADALAAVNRSAKLMRSEQP